MIDGDAAVRLHNKELPLNEHLANLREQAGQMAEQLQDNINSGDDSAKTARTGCREGGNRQLERHRGQGKPVEIGRLCPAMRFIASIPSPPTMSPAGWRTLRALTARRLPSAPRRHSREENPKWRVVRGTMSQEVQASSRGLTPETVALFAKEAGYENDPAYQEYLKLAINNSSPLKRMIHRKGIASYSRTCRACCRPS